MMNPELDPVYNYSYAMQFEKQFIYEDYFTYHKRYWYYVFHVIVAYLGIIFGIQKMMKNYQPMKLRGALFFWNSGLAMFSILGAIRSLPELYYTLKLHGLYTAICIQPPLDGVYGFWVVAFIISKFFELGDTIFIVLRKQKLIFLHWYHHITVIFCVFFTVTRPLSTLRWYVTTNYTIHSLMYTYYALRSRGFKIPKFISIMITSLQIFQMFIALFITFYALNERVRARACFVDDANIALGVVCYGSYAVLFGNFFYQTYLTRPKKSITSNNNVINNNVDLKKEK